MANAENAKLSTGPKSAEGKAKVAKNGVQHGLFARYDNLAPEHSARVDEYLDMLHEGFPQQCDLYEHFIREFAIAHWRKEHYAGLESSFFAAALHQERQDPESPARVGEGADDNTVSGYALMRDCKGPNVLAKLLRYAAKVDKELDRTQKAYAEVLGAVNTERNAGRNKAKPIPQPQPEPAQPEEPQTPRNSPCPCGSGVKYKRCCGVGAPAVTALPMSESELSRDRADTKREASSAG